MQEKLQYYFIHFLLNNCFGFSLTMTTSVTAGHGWSDLDLLTQVEKISAKLLEEEDVAVLMEICRRVIKKYNKLCGYD